MVIYRYQSQLEANARNGCVGSMQQIAGAKKTWMLDQHKNTNDIPTWLDLVGRDAYLRVVLECPNGGTYTIGKISEPPTCSIAHDNE